MYVYVCMHVCMHGCACVCVHARLIWYSLGFTEPMPPWPSRNGSSSKHSLEVQDPGPVSSRSHRLERQMAYIQLDVHNADDRYGILGIHTTPFAEGPNKWKSWRVFADVSHLKPLVSLVREGSIEDHNSKHVHNETIWNLRCFWMLVWEKRKHSKSIQKAFKKHSKSIQKAFKKHSKSIQKAFKKHSKSIQKAFKKHSKSIQKAVTISVWWFLNVWCTR